mmetsp:Transcript_30894/g.49555  ORF Transcript_30894/g.49555 Transcript_30894/m.49555 type:complete len:281 (-) Transcript_30894:541-1383(-)
MSGKDSNHDAQYGRDSGKHSNTKTLDDNGGGAGVGLVSDGDGRRFCVRSGILCSKSDGVSREKPNEDSEEETPRLLVVGTESQAESYPGQAQNKNAGKQNSKSDAPKQGVEHRGGVLNLLSLVTSLLKSLRGAHEESSYNRGDCSKASEPEREGYSCVAETLNTKGTGSDDGSSVGLKQVSSHTSNVTDVVTDVISNCSGVIGRVFWEVFFNLSYEISTNISSLGVDTTSDTSEESDGGSTEGKGRDGFPDLTTTLCIFVFIFETDVEDTDTEQGTRNDR